MQVLYIHPQNPQPRLLEQAVCQLKAEDVMIYADTMGYALAVAASANTALGRLQAIGGVDDGQKMALICTDISMASMYAQISNEAYRTLKSSTDETWFCLPANKTAPKKALFKKCVNIQIAQSPLVLGLLDKLGEPIISLPLAELGKHMTEAYEIQEAFAHCADVMLDIGSVVMTNIDRIDLTT